jgi:hypothetical protein
MTPVVVLLLEICHGQQEQIQALRDELAQLKGQKPKPVIKPSALEGERSGKEKGSRPKSRGKRDKTAKLEIHESVKRPPAADVPQNSRFKGYQDFVVQDIRIGVHNTRYRLERWVTPEGERLIGQLPAEIGGMHFGPQLRAFILYQYHHAHVTQPLLLEVCIPRKLDTDSTANWTLIPRESGQSERSDAGLKGFTLSLVLRSSFWSAKAAVWRYCVTDSLSNRRRFS